MMNNTLIEKRTFLVSLILSVAVIAVYWQVYNFGFISYDDPVYSSFLNEGLTIRKIFWTFITFDAANWHPITWISWLIDYELYGHNASGYHITNVIFHIANTILLFLLLRVMTGALYRSAFVAALFALHPLHVESVVWFSERKDVLSTFFLFLTMMSYVYYTRRPSSSKYLLTIIFFTLGLMSKPMLVTLPFILLLIDYWPLGRMDFGQKIPPVNKERKEISLPYLLKEKIPLFFLSALSSVITFLAQSQAQAVASLEMTPFIYRIYNALNSYSAYLKKCVSFHDTHIVYPFPTSFITTELFCSSLIIFSITLLVIILIRKTPYLGVGWFWFLGTLIPVIGLVRVGSQAMADRYTYVPLIGIFIASVWMLHEGIKNNKLLLVTLNLAGLFFILNIAYTSYWQVKYWKDDLSFFSKVLSHNPQNYQAHNILGMEMFKRANFEVAFYHYRAALEINPKYAPAYNNAGNALLEIGKIDEALSCYQKAANVNPRAPDPIYNIGRIYLLKNDNQKAVYFLEKAVELNPRDPDILNNLGVALMKEGKIKDALSHFEKAINLKPDFQEAQNNYRIAHSMIDKPDN